MNVIDSSLWLEYFADTEAGNTIAEVIENTDALIVPTITIYEVFKKLLFERNEDDALFAIAHMRQGKIIELTDELSLFAAKIGKDRKLPMADSIIYANVGDVQEVKINHGGHGVLIRKISLSSVFSVVKNSSRTAPSCKQYDRGSSSLRLLTSLIIYSSFITVSSTLCLYCLVLYTFLCHLQDT